MKKNKETETELEKVEREKVGINKCEGNKARNVREQTERKEEGSVKREE
jgi:hypothetical protein